MLSLLLNTLNSMDTVQVVLGKALVRAADRAARRQRVNRSALVRDALREYLKRLAIVEREARDRQGYKDRPVARHEVGAWDDAAAWPED